jgi:hypothetical protein
VNSSLAIGPLRAYRYWYMKWHAGQPVLQSLYTSTVWPSEGPLRATCEKPWSLTAWIRKTLCKGGEDVHSTPSLCCGCGIYALMHLDGSERRELFVEGGIHVCGVVLLWGRVIQHTHGFRAEYARPIKLLAVHRLDQEKRYLLDAVAQRYRVSIANHLGDLEVE